MDDWTHPVPPSLPFLLPTTQSWLFPSHEPEDTSIVTTTLAPFSPKVHPFSRGPNEGGEMGLYRDTNGSRKGTKNTEDLSLHHRGYKGSKREIPTTWLSNHGGSGDRLARELKTLTSSLEPFATSVSLFFYFFDFCI